MNLLVGAAFISFVIYLILIGWMFRSQERHILTEGALFSPQLRKAADDTRDLIERQNEMGYSRNLRYILHSRMLRLYQILDRHSFDRPYQSRIVREKEELDRLSASKESVPAFQPPADEQDAHRRMRLISQLKHVVALENQYNSELDDEVCNAENDRLHTEAVRVNVDHVFRKASELYARERYDLSAAAIQQGLGLIDDMEEPDGWLLRRRLDLKKLRDTVAKEEIKSRQAKAPEITVRPQSPVSAPAPVDGRHRVRGLGGEDLVW